MNQWMHWAMLAGLAPAAVAADLDVIGVTALRNLSPTLVGTGVVVAQPEGSEAASGLAWQVNPAAVGQPETLFTWIASGSSATNFPNALGTESIHGDTVGQILYGAWAGVAPGVTHVHNYEANHFASTLVPDQTVIAARVVSQSFTFTSQLPQVDLDYDDYAARYNTLFVSGAGNSGAVKSPASAYNGIAVGVVDGSSATGPTADGRAKPDLTAPGGYTSFSTPQVAGAAALLLQAGERGDAGPDTAAATDSRTLKALLLNGAVKPAGWTNGTSTPLDARHGAGVVQVYNAYRQLRGGKHPPTATALVRLGEEHPPANTSSNIPVRRGWSFGSISSTVTRDAVHHFGFDLSTATNRLFTFSATLVWLRQLNQITINNLDLFLYDAGSGALVASSRSSVDNVEHLHVKDLPPARYDLQVFKAGGPLAVSAAETYALAFEFGPPETPRLLGPELAGDAFQALLAGEPLQNYLIQATTDFANWTSVLTNQTSATGLLDFSVGPISAPAGRFFRALEWP